MKKIDLYWKENNWTFFDKSVNKRIVYPIVEKHAEFFFIDNENEISNKSDAYFVMIEKKDDLLNEYYTKFKFPYFGFNWNALWDCFCDLDWIEQKDIIVYHEALSTKYPTELRIKN